MRFLFTFAVADYTGASRMGHQYIVGLRERGHEVRAILAPRRPDGQAALIDVLKADGTECEEIDLFGFGRGIWNIRQLAEKIRRMHPDAVCSMNQGDVKTTGPAARLAQRPYVANVQNHRVFYGSTGSRWLKEFFYGAVMRSARRVVCASEATAREHAARFRVRSDRLVVVSNGVDVDACQRRAQLADRATVRAELGLPLEAFVFANTGRLSPQKGLDVLLEAMRSIAHPLDVPVHLLLIGPWDPAQPAYGERLRELASSPELSGRIHFLGWRNDIAEIHAATDFYVHSARWEGLPLAPFEAMACGRGAIITDCVGRPAGFRDGDQGWCVPKEDRTALAGAMLRVLQLDEKERLQMGASAASWVRENYSILKVRRLYAQELETVGATKRQRTGNSDLR